MILPLINRSHVPSWYGLFTTGPKTGQWQRFHLHTTMAPLILDGLYVTTEWKKGRGYIVFYQRILIDEERPDCFLLKEANRVRTPEQNFCF